MNRIDTQTWERAAVRDELKAAGLSARPGLAHHTLTTTFRCVTPDCVNARLGELLSMPVPASGRRGTDLVCPMCARPVEEVGPASTRTTPPRPGGGPAAGRSRLDDALSQREYALSQREHMSATTARPATTPTPHSGAASPSVLLVVDSGTDHREVPLLPGRTVVLGRHIDETAGGAW